MFKFIGWIFKASLFALGILVASHLVRWNGRTVSDQVRSTLSSAEKSPTVKTVTKKSKALINEAQEVADRAFDVAKSRTSIEIPDRDKVELQALINEKEE